MSRLLPAPAPSACSAAVLYFSAQPDQCYPGAGTGSGAGTFQDGKLCGEPDAAGRTRTNECKIDASPCLRSKEMSKEGGSAGEDEAPPQGRLVPSPQHKAACFCRGCRIRQNTTPAKELCPDVCPPLPLRSKRIDRVCEAQRSNESPSGAFKRQRGLRQQMEGRCPDKRYPNKIT